MSMIDTVRAGGFNLRGTIAEAVAAYRQAALRRKLYNRTVRELDSLTDRELTDLGIHRTSIRGVAAEAAAMARF